MYMYIHVHVVKRHVCSGEGPGSMSTYRYMYIVYNAGMVLGLCTTAMYMYIHVFK